MIAMTDREFQTISQFIRQKYGLNLSKKKYLIESKLWIELAKAHVSNYTEYWQKLCADGEGTMERRMMDLLTTNYSYFLRENKHFEFIQQTVLPQISQQNDAMLRILCAGCAAGQEAYTTAMYLTDARQMGKMNLPFAITAVDVSHEAVRKAQKARYGSDDYARLPGRWREQYCSSFQEGTFTIKDDVKEKVQVLQHNLMEPMLYARQQYQVVFCRNVLIYIHDPEREKILKNVVDTLQPGGYLFLGHTESLMQGIAGLTYIQPAIYRKEVGVHCRKESFG